MSFAELNEAQYKAQELRKGLHEEREVVNTLRSRMKELEREIGENTVCLSRANEDIDMMEAAKLESEERVMLARARVEDLLKEIEYLKEQVRIYQIRLGLLPPEQREEKKENVEPLRKAREPFAVMAARVQTQRTEEYWRRKAAEVQVDGVTGTTTNSPTVSESSDEKK